MSAVYTQRAFNFGFRTKNSPFHSKLSFPLAFSSMENWMRFIYRSVKNQFETDAFYYRNAWYDQRLYRLFNDHVIDDSVFLIFRIHGSLFSEQCSVQNICTFSFNYFHVNGMLAIHTRRVTHYASLSLQ